MESIPFVSISNLSMRMGSAKTRSPQNDLTVDVLSYFLPMLSLKNIFLLTAKGMCAEC